MRLEPLKICAVTGSRADWSLLSAPLGLLRDDPAFTLQLVATGQHLVPSMGDTISAIQAEGFQLDARVDTVLAIDTAVGVAKSLGLGVIGFADAFDRLRPDLILVLGDRYEIFAAVQAALVARIPVAHLCGGDVTEGALDEAIRHSITKMSHLHFVTNDASARRVLQLGEDPARVHVVGSPALDRIRTHSLMSREDFFASIGLSPFARNLLITFHPVTLEADSEQQCEELLAALDALGPDVGLIFTGTNTDPGGRAIETLVNRFVASHANAVSHQSLGMTRYFSALRHVDAIVGNSSSGLYEAPSFGIPTVNVGNRQGGRLRAASVFDCPPRRTEIRSTIERAFTAACRDVVNPYGDGHASERIVAILKRLDAPQALLKKKFFERAPA